MGRMGEEYDMQREDENCRDAQLPEDWWRKRIRFAPLPDRFFKYSESGRIRVCLSFDLSTGCIQFP
jgi:hypothetical protein